MIDETLLEAEEKMEKAVAVAKEEFAGIRTGRAHPSMFSKITAEYYGTQTPVNQLASFHMPEPRMVDHPAVRQVLARRDREGDQEQRPRGQPVQRRRDHPGGLPRALRGAAQGVHQGRPAQGRGQPGLHPQHPPARQGLAGQAGQGRRRRRGRGAAGRSGNSTTSPTPTSGRWTNCSGTRKPSSSRYSLPRGQQRRAACRGEPSTAGEPECRRRSPVPSGSPVPKAQPSTGGQPGNGQRAQAARAGPQPSRGRGGRRRARRPRAAHPVHGQGHVPDATWAPSSGWRSGNSAGRWRRGHPPAADPGRGRRRGDVALAYWRGERPLVAALAMTVIVVMAWRLPGGSDGLPAGHHGRLLRAGLPAVDGVFRGADAGPGRTARAAPSCS